MGRALIAWGWGGGGGGDVNQTVTEQAHCFCARCRQDGAVDVTANLEPEATFKRLGLTQKQSFVRRSTAHSVYSTVNAKSN